MFFPWLIFLAVSEGLGFTLMAVGQTYSPLSPLSPPHTQVGQNYSPPTHAAIILSLEGVFASVASYMFLDEVRAALARLEMLFSPLIQARRPFVLSATGARRVGPPGNAVSGPAGPHIQAHQPCRCCRTES